MVELAISALKKMQEDDSRRISSRAERLLAEFEQAHAPSTPVSVAPSKIAAPETELGPVSATSVSPMTSPRTTDEIEPTAVPLPPEVEKVSRSIDSSLASQKFSFNPSFWFKWIGIAVLGLILLTILYDFDTLLTLGDYVLNSYFLIILFGVIAGSLSFIQWFLFRNRLQDWWITANAAAGIVFGLFHRSLYYAGIDWGHGDLSIPLVVWLIGNFALGPILMRKTQERSKDLLSPLPAKPSAELIETRTRQNIFFILLSLSLLVFVLLVFTTVLSLTSAADILWILLGIAHILVGITFILKKEVPRNFGFITLVISSFLNGIIVELIAFSSNLPQSLFTFPALMSLSSGIFFATQRETRKNFGFLVLSGYLISLSIAQIGIYISAINNTFLIISALFALPAAIFFFRDK
jgi:hypothetical protein